MRRGNRRSIPVRVSMEGLRRPGTRGDGWATSRLDQTAEAESDSSAVNPRRGGRPASDSSDVPSRGGGRRMSRMIDSKLQSALAGAGFVNEDTFQQALDQQRDQDLRMAALEQQQRAMNAGECPQSWTIFPK